VPYLKADYVTLQTRPCFSSRDQLAARRLATLQNSFGHRRLRDHQTVQQCFRWQRGNGHAPGRERHPRMTMMSTTAKVKPRENHPISRSMQLAIKICLVQVTVGTQSVQIISFIVL